MNQPRVLLVGDFAALEEGLSKTGYQVIADSNPVSACKRLEEEWFHLAIIQLRPDDEQVNVEMLNLARQTNGLAPKIILSPQPLDQVSQTVREVLTTLQHPSPAVAFASQQEGVGSIVDIVDKAIKRYVGLNHQLKILPGPDIFYTLARRVRPDTSPDLWVNELEDLFRILFERCSCIDLYCPENLQGRREDITTLWVQPKSDVVPQEHPILVKCGVREDIERIRSHYGQFLCRITGTHLAGFARTRHFAAIALPAPMDRPGSMHEFPALYRSKARATDLEGIHRLIDDFFREACRPWYQQIEAPPDFQGQDLQRLYLNRLGLKDRRAVGNAIQELVEIAKSYGLMMEQKGEEIGFRIPNTAKPDFYPNPIPHLYGDKGTLKLIPSQIRITHGDLRGANFCIDANGLIRLDGYESMDWGPFVADVAGLEAILQFHCMEDDLSWDELYQFERTVLSPTRFDDPFNTSSRHSDIQQILNVLEHLRKKWAQRLSSSNMQEYYASLFFFTLRELVTNEKASPNRRNPMRRKLHALLCATMICYRLMNWNKWDGWPGRKEVAV